MASTGSRKGAAPAGVVLMLLAFAVMGGFLYWLNVTAEPSNLAIVEEEDAPADFGDAVGISADSFGVDPMAFLDRAIRMSNLEVSGNLGAEAFFIDVENQPGPYLVKMGPDLLADSLIVMVGDVVSVTGSVAAMTDSIANSWVESGAISEGEMMVATFNESFILATVVEIATPVGAGDAGGQ